MLKLEFNATYKGVDYSVLVKDEEFSLVMESMGKTPQVKVMVLDQVFFYPSKKKFLDVWSPEEGWEKKKGTVVVDTLKLHKQDRGKKGGIEEVTGVQAGAVIYTEMMMSINKFNEMSEVTYAETPEKITKFEVNFDKTVYDTKTREETKLYGAAVLSLEVSIGGLKRKVYNEGISFHTPRELENVNAYAPKMYLQLFDSIVETALLYVQALNPDDPEVAKQLEDAKAERESSNLQSPS